MSDEDPPFTPMHPAIPSRATGEAKPIVTPGTGLEAALSLQVSAAEPRKVGKSPLLAAPYSGKRSAKSLDAALKPTRKEKRAVRKLKRGIAKKAVKQAAKNPNRPLELKSQMHALLEAYKSLHGAEHQAFTEAVLAMQDLSKPARKHVLEALGRVYG